MKSLWELRLRRDKVRDKNRIPVLIDLITKIWVSNPDLRLCQLIGNALGSGDQYYTEDDRLEKNLREIYNIPEERQIDVS
jgi:hypothetical protein